MPRPELLGLVLAGGQSQRMGQDKSLMIYPEISSLSQRERLLWDLEAVGIKSFISCRIDQVAEKDLQQKIILDRSEFQGGPGVGLLSAHLKFPESAFLVVACDFPWLGQTEFNELLTARDSHGSSVATQHPDNTLEPLFAIWEPETLKLFLTEFKKGNRSPQKLLQQTKCKIFSVKNQKALTNINTKDEVEAHEQLRLSKKN